MEQTADFYIAQSRGDNNALAFSFQSGSTVQAKGNGGAGDTGPDYSACDLTYDEVGSGARETFECYTEAEPITDPLSAHLGWSAAWALKNNPLGVQARDEFESYAEEDPVTSTLNGVTGFADAWALKNNPLGIQSRDTFEAYSEEDPITSNLGSGDGWDEIWVLKSA